MMQEMLKYEPVQIEIQSEMLQGSKEDRDKVLLGYSRYVWKLVHKFPNPEEFFQTAFMGLCKAAEDYDPSKGTNFQTYATWWLRDAIKQARLKLALVHVPYDMIQLVQKYRAAEEQITLTLAEPAKFDDICDYMELDEVERSSLLKALHPADSLPKKYEAIEERSEDKISLEMQEEVKKATEKINLLLTEEESDIFWAKLDDIPREAIAEGLGITMKELADKERTIKKLLNA
jgi:RNA polymerase sigma factor (sigma-70 family)